MAENRTSTAETENQAKQKRKARVELICGTVVTLVEPDNFFFKLIRD